MLKWFSRIEGAQVGVQSTRLKSETTQQKVGEMK
jgi:hypothetical protein